VAGHTDNATVTFRLDFQVGSELLN